MKKNLQVIVRAGLVASLITGLIPGMMGCGSNQANRRGGLPALNGSRGTNLFLGSGDAGSPNGAATGSTGTPAAQSATTPTLNSNPFARTSITTASDPQQCANIYNSYARLEGNFERALFDLTTCLNQVMIRQNPGLFQQYQNLYQYQQNPQGGWVGWGGIQ